MEEKEIKYLLETIKAGMIFMFVCNISLLVIIIYIITHHIGA